MVWVLGKLRKCERVLSNSDGKVMTTITEKDPNGIDLKTPGSKADAGKAPVTRGLLGYFPRAVLAVAAVSKCGAEKYSWAGWREVPDGVNRYLDALGRHLAYREIEGEKDKDTGLDHLAQVAWNSLAALELYLKEKEQPNKVVS